MTFPTLRRGWCRTLGWRRTTRVLWPSPSCPRWPNGAPPCRRRRRPGRSRSRAASWSGALAAQGGAHGQQWLSLAPARPRISAQAAPAPSSTNRCMPHPRRPRPRQAGPGAGRRAAPARPVPVGPARGAPHARGVCSGAGRRLRHRRAARRRSGRCHPHRGEPAGKLAACCLGRPARGRLPSLLRAAGGGRRCCHCRCWFRCCCLSILCALM